MPAFLNENNYMADVVKYDISLYSRDTRMVAANSGKLAIGAVLGRKADGNFAPLDPAATTGEQVAAGVLLKYVDATGTDDVKAVILTRHAIVADRALIWPDPITDNDKAAAIAELESIGIVAREEV